MQSFLYRLLIGCAVIWLVEKILGVFRLSEPANQIIFVITIIVSVLFILFGGYYWTI